MALQVGDAEDRMKAFIVNRWNGCYDESRDYNVGIFQTLEEAREYCKNNIPTSQYYNEPLSIYVYSIEEWDGTTSRGTHDP